MMNWEQIEAQWKQLGEYAKAKWNKLTDEILSPVRRISWSPKSKNVTGSATT